MQNIFVNYIHYSLVYNIINSNRIDNPQYSILIKQNALVLRYEKCFVLMKITILFARIQILLSSGLIPQWNNIIL